MERKYFLELCRKNSMFPKTALVKIKSIDVSGYPIQVVLQYDSAGNGKSTAVIKDIKSNSIYYADLKDLEEI